MDTFESLEDYFKYKRKSDINRLEAYFDQKVSELEAAALEKAKARYGQLAKDLVNPPPMIAPQIAAE